MNKKDLDFVLMEGEGLKIEFKESFDPKSLAKEIVSFANASGGRIFLGVNDKGKVVGVTVTNKLKSQVQDIARNCDPSVPVRLETIGNVLVVNVNEGQNKPYKCSSGFYLRQGANTQKLSRDEILQIAADFGKLRFDEQLNTSFDFKSFDKNKFNEYLKKSTLTLVDSIEQTLVNLSLGSFVDGKFIINNAGILMFSKEPSKYIRQNFLTCVLFKGVDRVKVLDRKDFTGDVLELFKDGMNFLEKHLNLEYVIKGAGPRQEILEIPPEALREALLNAILHRDYSYVAFGVFIEIFDDRAEITNWGKLPFAKEELGKLSVPRNPILFDLFYRLDLIEKIGSGISRIRKLVNESNLKIQADSFFRITFFREKGVEKGVEKLSENQKKILALIEQDPYISKEQLQEKGNLTKKTVEYNIAKLKQKGLLKRIGAAKGGHWKIE